MGHGRRFAYNWGLERWRTHHRETGGTITTAQLCRELTELKRRAEFSWLREVDSQLLQQAFLDLRRAFINYFERRARYPRFRSRKTDCQRFRIPQRIRVELGRVYVPKIGWIRMRQSREVIGSVGSATFKKDPTGKWFVSILGTIDHVEREAGALSPSQVVGIDLGIRQFAVLSDGTSVDMPAFHKLAERRLRRSHRAVSRKRRGSRNRQKARRELAVAYRRTADRRKDFLHKLTTELTNSHEAICIEDLGVTGLARTKLASRILDSSFRELRRQLEYKSAWKGTALIAVDRFFPSSKTCSRCGVKNTKLSVSDREWTCSCGATHDRDLNAARNIANEGIRNLVAAGHADTENACGADVGLSTRAVGDEAGIANT